MRLHCPEIAANTAAGQFVNIKVNNGFIPLLRKPFSVSASDPEQGWFEIVWKIVGQGTLILSQKTLGDHLSVLGPLGQPYNIDPECGLALLVGGGLGVAPFPLLCKQVLAAGIKTEVFLGARNQEELVLVDDLRTMGIECFLATEDGSVGTKGFVTDPLLQRISQLTNPETTMLLSCGPIPFLKAMQDISATHSIRGQISIETMMGCGFGICMGCPVEATDSTPEQPKFKLTCMDGPVFDSREVVLHE
jgi:dihydroorotate dehydrogenase electron transfer subunit